VSAVIYLEGGATGANSKYLDSLCTRAFHKLLDKMGFTGRKPRLVACGGRNDVFNRFQTSLRNGGYDYIAMWIDSEEPMADRENAWEHLATVSTVAQWERPENVVDDQVLFMTTCMETWIVADRAMLRAYYGPKLMEQRLPTLTNLETKNRHSVQQSLVSATENCASPYRKGEHSYLIFEKVRPTALWELPSFSRITRILQDRLC
jgi:Domain of unknown function (DUF4276)